MNVLLAFRVKKLTAIFQSEIFRPVVTLVLPGCVAISTGSIALGNNFPKIGNLVVAYPWPSAIIVLLLVITLGLITEDLGARLERRFEQKLVGYEQHLQEWYDYLRLADERPVGHRYLKALVLRLKFELGMAIASLPCAFGALWIHVSWAWRGGILIAALTAGFYFCIEANCTVETLSKLRRELLKSSATYV